MSGRKQVWANAHSQLWTSPIPRSSGSCTQSELPSVVSPHRDRSLLEGVGNFDRANDASALHNSHINNNPLKERTLVQVSDILESYGAISEESDIPAVLLSVVKELEESKRENNFKDLLLREYADAVRRRFCLYGDDSPPSVAELSSRLRDGAIPKPAAGPAPVWLEEQLNDLRRLIQKEAQACFGEEADLPLPMLLPDATHTQSNIFQVFQRCREVLAKLSSEYQDAKCTIMEDLDQVGPSKDRRAALTLTEALAELHSRQRLDGSGVAGSDTPDGDKNHTFKAVLQSMIDTIPASLQIHFQLQVRDAPVLNRCRNLELLLKFLLSEYLSMERYMEEVEKQRLKLVQVFRLPSTEFEGDSTDDKTQIGDALTRSLENLKKTVTAVVTFPHQISEEEVALRRVSTEAVEELAQLLVESRHAGSVAGTPGPPGNDCGSSMVRVEPPTRNLLDMVAMVKSRFATLYAQQQRKELTGAQNRVGFAHMEEAMRGYGKQIMQQLRDLCSMQDDGPGTEQSEVLSELMGSFDVERNLTPTKLDCFLGDVWERLRMVKTKYQRALSAAASNKARADTAVRKSAAAQKKLQRVAVCVERISKEGLGLTFPSEICSSGADADYTAVRGGAAVENGGGRGDGVSALRRLNLRPGPDASSHKSVSSSTAAAAGKEATPSAAAAAGAGVAATVTEGNVLEALQYLATHVCANDALRDEVKLRAEVEQLRNSQARWRADTSAFHEAMSMLMQRLASNGQLVKQSLFMMGTDESAKDDLVEEILRYSESKTEEEVEYVERSLAELLQKYTRWAQRLQQTTEDHLYTQRKIVKYFAAVRRFFTSRQGKDAAPPEDIPDDNLYDIDSSLMRAADVILPALDAAIQGVEGQRGVATTTSSSPLVLPKAVVAEGQANDRQDAITQLIKDSAAGAVGSVLPYDHRIARLYETVARLYTAVTSLLQVHYLCIPLAVKRRSAGDVELIFDGGSEEDGFVDIDLDRLIRVSQRRASGDRDGAEEGSFAREDAQNGTGGANAPPHSTVTANNDILLRVTYQNMMVLQDTLKRFSENHKMAAIVLQRDMEALQQRLALMLEQYSEVDMETAFHQSRSELHELYVTLRDRARVQKGCYFFNRVGGEGSCTWVTALEKLGEGFRIVVDRLVQRTAQVAEDRELTEEVVGVCATYLNWAANHALPPSHTLPPELLALCLRDGKGANDKSVTAVGAVQSPPPPPSALTAATAKTARRPPKPSCTPSLTPRESIKQQQESQGGQGVVDDAAKEATVPCFTENRVVLKVMGHMLQLAQHAAEKTDSPTPAADAAARQEAETQVHQLTEELSLLREAMIVAERHVDELTEAKQTVERQRDQAQSEAAVARAELRRWKRLQQQQQRQDTEQATPPRSLDADKGNAVDGASPSYTPQASSALDAAALGNAAMDEATVREVMAYMKRLSGELQATKERAGAGTHCAEHRRQCQRWQQQEGGVESEGGDELVSSPYSAELSGMRKEEAPCGDVEGGRGDVMLPAHLPPPPPNRYAALAEELRHRYGSSASAPMVVVDARTHYSARRSSSLAQRRYSPVKFHSPAYDACDRYYARELADGEGRRGVELAQRHGSSSSSSAGLHTGAPPSALLIPHTRTAQRRPSRRSGREEVGDNYDAYLCGSTGGKAAGLPSSAATSHRYPRSLSRDEPFRVSSAGAAGVATPPAHVYHAPQRATPVTSSAHVSPSAGSYVQRPSTAITGRVGVAPGEDCFRGRYSGEDGDEKVEDALMRLMAHMNRAS
ncbi:hypothetical protein ABL78_7947, partial [Leptomonas seymouri]